jgi:hypothetical protein
VVGAVAIGVREYGLPSPSESMALRDLELVDAVEERSRFSLEVRGAAMRVRGPFVGCVSPGAVARVRLHRPSMRRSGLSRKRANYASGSVCGRAQLLGDPA